MNLDIHPPLPKRKDFRIGILGSGFIVDQCHLVAYRKAGFNPVAIASRNRDHAAQVTAQHGIPKVHDTYNDLLADPSIEVLDIAVPPNALLPLIREACERRTVKGILAQKPLGVNYAEALEIVNYCDRAGITLAVNQNMRFDQSVRAAKTLLTNGTIGEPVLATIEMRGIPHWQPWQAGLGWATLRIMSIHHLDTFRYWFGSPERIFCSTRPDPRTKFPHTDGICTYILEYANGLRCIAIDDPWTGPAKEGCPSDIYIKWRIEGLNGLAIGDIGWCKEPYTTPSTIGYAAKGQSQFESPTWPESWFPDAFIGTMADLLIALENRTEPTLSGRDNLKTMDLVELAYLSAKDHQSLAIDHSANFDTHRVVTRPAAHTTEITVQTPTISFSPRAQQLLMYARKEADHFGHTFVGTEHLLLGLVALGEGTAVNVLFRLGVRLDEIRAEVEKMIPRGPGKFPSNIPYTPRVKRVLALATRQAKNLNHSYVGTEHILLGMIEEGDGVAARILKQFNVNIETTRGEILKELDPSTSSHIPTTFNTQMASSSQPLRNDLTPRANQVMALARQEAVRLKHDHVGPEHLLLGLIALGKGVAVNVLARLGMNLEDSRNELEKISGRGPEGITENPPYAPSASNILTLAGEYAKNLNHAFIGTEHILLGLLEERDGIHALIFKRFDVNTEEVREEILRELRLPQ